MFKRGNKRAQVAIYVIVAIVVVAGILLYFILRERTSVSGVPINLQPVFDEYKACIKDETLAAASLMGSQGGRIAIKDYSPGSAYAPFSSQLNFLGFPVPYWYYITGNGVIKEQVPTKSDMELELGDYLQQRLSQCDFSEQRRKGFGVTLESPQVKATINDGTISVDVKSRLTARQDGDSISQNEFKVDVISKLGKFYRTAIDIYNKEKKDAFLENYSVDVLRLYAPVDGVEISCSGKVWRSREVVDTLYDALEANIAAIKFSGSYYSLTDDKHKYFVVDQPVDESVNLIFSRDWPSKVEINGDGVNDELMMAQPVGNQQGMGMMGFCYSPYHFVYDLSYPVLIQVYDGKDIFQFPVVVVVDKNMPRNALPTTEQPSESDVDICKFSTQDLAINLFDNGLNPVDGDVSYTCFNQRCSLGESTNGVLVAKVPSCINGKVEVSATGYSTSSDYVSSNEQSSVDIFLDREYMVNLSLNVGGKPFNGNAVISFNGNKSVGASFPDSKEVRISEGNYDVTVYAYANTSITIPSSTKTQCSKVPSGGLAGFFGGTTEQCYDINVPETKIESALIGGGHAGQYVLASQLERGVLNIDVGSLPTPTTLDQLQNNFQAFDQMGVSIS